MNKIEVNVKDAIVMYVVAMGENDGNAFVYHPNLPSNLSENLDMVVNRSSHCRADLVSIRVNNELGIEVWFVDNSDGESFFYLWETLMKIKPLLCASIITHIYDMVENLKEC